MRILIACEESGTVRDAMIAKGHMAVSCDLVKSRKPGPHIVGDVRGVIKKYVWDAMIAFPDCTYLTCAAEWAYGDEQTKLIKPGTLTGQARRDARDNAFAFFMELALANIPRIAIENPVGVVSSRWRKPDQIIQPYEYGEDASKKTCLWLKGLPLLQPTKLVNPRWVDGKPRYANQTDSGQNRLGPGKNRARDRAKTYGGIAQAMSDQWFLE